jgi:hypothetical protein
LSKNDEGYFAVPQVENKVRQRSAVIWTATIDTTVKGGLIRSTRKTLCLKWNLTVLTQLNPENIKESDCKNWERTVNRSKDLGCFFLNAVPYISNSFIVFFSFLKYPNMKKALFILFVCVSFYAQAQRPAFGVKGGFNFSNIKAEGLEAAVFDSRTLFHLGVLVHIPISRQLALQPELLFSKQGARYRTTYDTYDTPGYRSKWHVNYLNVPVLFQYRLGQDFRVETGPQVGFLLSAKTIEEGIGEVRDIQELLNKVDFSWSVGSTYQTKVGLGLAVRYNLGLSEMNKGVFISSSSLRNRVLQIGLFYQFSKAHSK